MSWVGAFNGWSPGSDPAVRLSTGVHYWALVTSAEDPAGAGYKWHAAAAPEVWRAPPEATRYEYDEFGEIGLVAAPRDRPWLERFPGLTTPRMPAPRTVRVRVPAGFAPGPRRTLLLHDGQNVFGPEGPFGGWRVDAALTGAYADVLAVAVDNAPDRMDAYTHVPDVIGGTTVGGRAADYLALLEEEVLPFVRSRYGVEARGITQMIAGSSLGGLVTLFSALERPGLAGCVAGLSSTLGWGAFGRGGPGTSDTLMDRWESRLPVAVYLDSGGGVRGSCVDLDGDGVHEDSDDRDNYCTTVQMRDHLLGLGYAEGRDLFYRWDPGATHDEAAWRARFPGVLDACAAAGWRAP